MLCVICVVHRLCGCLNPTWLFRPFNTSNCILTWSQQRNACKHMCCLAFPYRLDQMLLPALALQLPMASGDVMRPAHYSHGASRLKNVWIAGTQFIFKNWAYISCPDCLLAFNIQGERSHCIISFLPAIALKVRTLVNFNNDKNYIKGDHLICSAP